MGWVLGGRLCCGWGAAGRPAAGAQSSSRPLSLWVREWVEQHLQTTSWRQPAIYAASNTYNLSAWNCEDQRGSCTVMKPEVRGINDWDVVGSQTLTSHDIYWVIRLENILVLTVYWPSCYFFVLCQLFFWINTTKGRWMWTTLGLQLKNMLVIIITCRLFCQIVIWSIKCLNSFPKAYDDIFIQFVLVSQQSKTQIYSVHYYDTQRN